MVQTFDRASCNYEGERHAVFKVRKPYSTKLAYAIVFLPLRFLASHSAVFHKLNQGPEVSMDDPFHIDLPPEVFEEFVYWMKSPLPISVRPSARKLRKPIHFLDFYILAQDLNIPTLQNWAITEYWNLVYDLLQETIAPNALICFFFQLRPDSLVRPWVAHLLSDWFKAQLSGDLEERNFALKRRVPGYSENELREVLEYVEKHGNGVEGTGFKSKYLIKTGGEHSPSPPVASRATSNVFEAFVDLDALPEQHPTIDIDAGVQSPLPISQANSNSIHAAPSIHNQEPPDALRVDGSAKPEAQKTELTIKTNDSQKASDSLQILPGIVPAQAGDDGPNTCSSEKTATPRLDSAAEESSIDWKDPRRAVIALRRPDDSPFQIEDSDTSTGRFPGD